MKIKFTINNLQLSNIPTVRHWKLKIGNWKFFPLKPGFIALVSILIIDAIALLIGVGLVLRAVGENKISLSSTFKQRAEMAAGACAEHALNQLKETTVYTGNEPLSVGSDNCYIMTVTGISNSDRTVQTTSTVSGYTSKIKIQITKVNPIMIISSWENVTDF
ncbi:hypothetical protein KKF59_02530 [Patescibacteria group bacterium]|nr:hypothetical protein [Patescibacteria group bacterium]MBU1034567.1 hypothetical protein [Patescibacteria group bacterium]MBU1907986.1 hypothetical protein [Patescibacteria group bacterium]